MSPLIAFFARLERIPTAAAVKNAKTAPVGSQPVTKARLLLKAVLTTPRRRPMSPLLSLRTTFVPLGLKLNIHLQKAQNASLVTLVPMANWMKSWASMSARNVHREKPLPPTVQCAFWTAIKTNVQWDLR